MPPSEDPVINVELALLAGQDSTAFQNFVTALAQSSKDLSSTATSLKEIAVSYETLMTQSAKLALAEKSRSTATAADPVASGGSEGASRPAPPAPPVTPQQPDTMGQASLQALGHFGQFDFAQGAAVLSNTAARKAAERVTGGASSPTDAAQRVQSIAGADNADPDQLRIDVGGHSYHPLDPLPHVDSAGGALFDAAAIPTGSYTEHSPDDTPQNVRSLLSKAKGALAGEFLPEGSDHEARTSALKGLGPNILTSFMQAHVLSNAMNRQNMAQDVNQGAMLGESTTAPSLGPFSIPILSDAGKKALRNKMHDALKGAFEANISGKDLEQLRQNAFDVGVTGGEKDDTDQWLDSSAALTKYNKALGTSPAVNQLKRQATFGGNMSFEEFNKHMANLNETTKGLNISMPQMIDDLQQMSAWTTAHGGSPRDAHEQLNAIYQMTGQRLENIQPLMNTPQYTMNAARNLNIMPWEQGLMSGPQIAQQSHLAFKDIWRMRPHLAGVSNAIKINDKIVGHDNISGTRRDIAYLSNLTGLSPEIIRTQLRTMHATDAFGDTQAAAGTLSKMVDRVKAPGDHASFAEKVRYATQEAKVLQGHNAAGISMDEVMKGFDAAVKDPKNASLVKEDAHQIADIRKMRNTDPKKLRAVEKFMEKQTDPDPGGKKHHSEHKIELFLSNEAKRLLHFDGGTSAKDIAVGAVQAGHRAANAPEEAASWLIHAGASKILHRLHL